MRRLPPVYSQHLRHKEPACHWRSPKTNVKVSDHNETLYGELIIPPVIYRVWQEVGPQADLRVEFPCEVRPVEEDGHSGAEGDVEAKHGEVALVVVADAGVGEEAVVVAFQHTAVAHRAVVGARRLLYVTCTAVTPH